MKILLSLFFIFPIACLSGEVLTEFPEEVNPNDKFVFYSHGYIVEGGNPTPENSRWGVYDFPKIKKQLSGESYKLIAYHRAKNTDPVLFSQKLADNVLTLIKKGVEPSNITLIGFSRGGAITILTSSILAREDINFIILAACGDYINKNEDLKIYGKVLSLIEVSDNLVDSCQPLINRSKGVNSFEEIKISTGKEHGAFYLPLAVWLEPVKKWINKNHPE